MLHPCFATIPYSMIPFFYKKLTSLPKKDSIIVSGITLVITRKAIKHLLLRIHHTDGSVNVSAPEKMSLEEIR